MIPCMRNLPEWTRNLRNVCYGMSSPLQSPPSQRNIGAGLELVFKKELTNLLREYAYVFALSPKDMPGLDESVAMHKLSVDPKKAPKETKATQLCT